MILKFSKSKTVRHISFVFLILWMCIIFFLSSETAADSDDTSDGVIEVLLSSVYPEFDTLDIADKQYVVESFSAPIRKAAHFGEFLVLGALSFAYFVTFTSLSQKTHLLFPAVLGFLYAISDEVHQLFVPGRACRILDIYIDSCGVLAGVIFLFLIYRGSEANE